VSLRLRLLGASVLLALIPLLLLAAALRRGMSARLTREHTHRVETLIDVIQEDLDSKSRTVDERLAALKEQMGDDNRFRLAAVDHRPEERAYLLDYARRAMRLQGLSLLWIQDATGRILSSGHFPNEHGRSESVLPRFLAALPQGSGFVRARRPEGPFLAWARVDSVELGGRRFTLVAGIETEKPFLTALARDPELAVSLVTPMGIFSSDSTLVPSAGGEALSEVPLDVPAQASRLAGTGFLVRELRRPYADPRAGRPDSLGAAILVAYPLQPLQRLLRGLDLWLLGVLLVSSAGSLLLAAWFSARISRPIEDLAARTARLDFDRLDVDFSSSRRDEVGALSRTLDAFARRLRTGAQRLRETERRATLGEVARQVNHDIRNGLTPVRNVLRHLDQVAATAPETLAGVFREREPVLRKSLEYLDTLASNYARLSRGGDVGLHDLNRVAGEVIGALEPPPGVTVRLEGAPAPLVLRADPVGLRRILENLLSNALESLGEGPGEVVLALAEESSPAAGRRARLTVRDSGPGLAPEIRDRIFDDFYTTKKSGSGLGLSIVRRLVSDLDGKLSAESEPGRGAMFTVTLTLAEPDPKETP